MSRKMYLAACAVLVCGLVANVSADLVAHWDLDEGSGGTTTATVGSPDADGTLVGASWLTTDLAPISGNAACAFFNSANADRIETNYVGILGPAARGVTVWIKAEPTPTNNAVIVGWGPNNPTERYSFRLNASAANGSQWALRLEIQGSYAIAQTPLNDGQWHHVAVTHDAGSTIEQVSFYVDGQLEEGLSGTSGGGAMNTASTAVFLGNSGHSTGGYGFDGAIDDVRIYDHRLTEVEIQTILKGSAELAANPGPTDAVDDVPRDVALSWTPGAFAVKHDVYLGATFDDVNNASADTPLDVLVSQGQADASYDAGILDFGQTYYWRVDEVNGAPDNTVFKGDVWSFEVEPFAIPVTNIIATASSSHDSDMVPEKTIDGSGLDALDQHSTEPKDMWLSGMGDPVPSIQYEFDMAYKLHEMWVWNSNQAIESFVGLGAKDVTIEISINGMDWTQLEDVPPFAQAPGLSGYAHNTTIDMGGAVAKYVRLTINAGYGMLPQNGLSEVRFLYIPTFAREAQPADGDTTNTVDVALNWRAGREAASHEVYLGTDPNGLVLAATVTDNSYDAADLDYASTYYWKIVEVNDAEDPAAYAGPVWSFDTPAFGIVDDFDQYNDDCDRIFFAWEDGLGHNGGEDVEDCAVLPSNGNGGGSIVGNAQSPFAERTIIHSGSQSMPLEYDNAFGPSEATLSLNAQDWTAHGIKSLSLYFRGDPANTGQLYVKINNSKVSYEGLAGAVQRAQWTPWNIDLATVGANLQSVTSLAVGIDGATASGMLYVDDIRLYPQTPEFVTPVDPAPDNLVAHYAFEGNANDSVGGLHGTLVGNAEFVPGQQGQALSINTLTVTDYVDITGYQGILGASAVTIAAWVNTSSDATGAIIGWGPNVSGQRFGFRIDVGRLRTEHAGGNIQGDTAINDGTWHHVAVTVEANSTVSYPQVKLWLDGQDDTRPTTDPDAYDLTADQDVSIGRRPASDDRYFIGLIDELYIYDRVLSQAEIAGLAGMTQPFDKPFE